MRTYVFTYGTRCGANRLYSMLYKRRTVIIKPVRKAYRTALRYCVAWIACVYSMLRLYRYLSVGTSAISTGFYRWFLLSTGTAAHRRLSDATRPRLMWRCARLERAAGVAAAARREGTTATGRTLYTSRARKMGSANARTTGGQTALPI